MHVVRGMEHDRVRVPLLQQTKKPETKNSPVELVESYKITRHFCNDSTTGKKKRNDLGNDTYLSSTGEIHTSNKLVAVFCVEHAACIYKLYYFKQKAAMDGLKGRSVWHTAHTPTPASSNKMRVLLYSYERHTR